ncbi:glutathione S-transferase C-terminal domain-containing protein [Streptomyces sp. NPDC093595]|uniref:glutathione S-transferase C-terminal domain-containing protein n=1 Tax=Streptomyces sp. NPDC093595 TaxID=3366045 RepID=UPI003802D39B
MSATSPTAVPARPFRERIGPDPRSGHYAAPRRYRLHVSPSDPGCLLVAVTHGLLDLGEALPLTVLPALPDTPDGGYTVLRPLYEAAAHRFTGPAAAPVLSDGWTGRIVSAHAPDILEDLVLRFAGDRGDALHPPAARAESRAVAALCELGVHEAAQHAGELGLGGDAVHRAPLNTLLGALDALERRLTGQEYVLGGDTPSLADVRVWVTLLYLDTVHRWHLDADAVHRIAAHPSLWSYARRLAAHPAFGTHLDVAAIAARHHARCRGREAAGAAMPIVQWPVRPPLPPSRPATTTLNTPA